jgi:hypothetical protein
VTHWRFIGLVVVTVVGALASWQLIAGDPWLPPIATGLVLLIFGLVAGIRVGYESARKFVEDATRTNKLLAEQNRDLVELNQRLLREMLPDCAPAAEETEESVIEK